MDPEKVSWDRFLILIILLSAKRYDESVSVFVWLATCDFMGELFVSEE
jgi:hypothetical protein